MKIVIFGTYNKSFLSDFFLELCDDLSIKGHKVYVICLKGSSQVLNRPSGVTVIIHQIRPYHLSDSRQV